jgi:hypothetical protein
MWNCVASVLCAAVFVATTYARPSSQSYSAEIDEKAKSYAKLHPNTGLERNPEYGEYLEGDILVRDSAEHHDESNPLNAIPYPDYVWPNGILYYTILTDGYTSENIASIESAIAELVELTKVNGQLCVQILPRQSQADYVYVENYSGCSSYIGRIEGPQRLSLVNGCFSQGTIMHEFLHAFGFFHEQTRYDRDDWVTINWSNIEPGYEDNFEMKTPDEIDLLGTPYDYGSVMHYDAYAFAIDESIPTIIPHDPNAVIGNRVTMSALDIERVQIHYGCLAAADSRFFKHLAPK